MKYYSDSDTSVGKVLKYGDAGTGTGENSIQPSGVSVNSENSMNIPKDLHVGGDLYIDGTAFVVSAGSISTNDKFIFINNGEVGFGITPNPPGQAGIQVVRGLLPDYQFLFEEDTQTFRIGEVSDATGVSNLQAVATREDVPNDQYIPYWDAASNMFKTAGSVPLGDAGVPSGAVMWFYADVAPSGWTIQYSPSYYDNIIAIKGGSFGSTGGVKVGSWTISGLSNNTAPAHVHTGSVHVHTGPNHRHTGPSHTHTGPSHNHTLASHWHVNGVHTHSAGSHTHNTSNHTLTLAEIPSHRHPAESGQHFVSYTGGGIVGSGDQAKQVYNTGYAGGGGAHNHGLTGISAGNVGSGGNVATSGPNTGNTGSGGTGATGAGGTGNTGYSGTANTGGPSSASTGSSGNHTHTITSNSSWRPQASVGILAMKD